jgi:hypothetical protein
MLTNRWSTTFQLDLGAVVTRPLFHPYDGGVEEGDENVGVELHPLSRSHSQKIVIQ